MVSREQRQRLLKLTSVAVDTIMSDFDTLVSALFTNSVITDGMYYEIEANRNKMARARELHLLIMRRGPGAYEKYYKSLMEAGMDDLAGRMADLLDPQYIQPFDRPQNHHPPHHPSSQPRTRQNYSADTVVYNVQEAPQLPPVWPPPGYDPIDLKMQACDIYDPSTQKNIKNIGSLVYNLPRGYAIIINNKEFNGARDPSNNILSDRFGTDVDSTHMYSTLDELGFTVEVVRNCNAQTIVLEVAKAASNELSKTCFICVLLSHGANGAVYGVDGKPVRIGAITDAAECKLPTGPKVFIIQACQGVKKDTGGVQEQVEKMDTNLEETSVKQVTPSGDVLDREFVSLHMVPARDDQFLISLRETEKELEKLEIREGTDSSGGKTGAHADIFVAMATVEGYVSWRNQRGSWFIQALIYVLRKYAYSEDIDGIFTMVTNLVLKQEHQLLGYKQVAMKRSTLNKKLFFFPGVDQTQVDGLLPKQKRC